MAGRVAAVTRAGSGIGRVTARDLTAAGPLVVCADVDSDTATETAELLRAAGSDAVARCLDVTDIPAFRASIEAVHSRYYRIDVLRFAGSIAMSRTLRGGFNDEVGSRRTT